MELNYEAIGIRIQRLRKEKGLTQQKLAEMSDQDPSNISHIDRGATKLSLPTIVNIANVLDVTVDYFLCDSLESATFPYDRIATEILSDCSHRERIIITETMIAMKEILRKTESTE